MYTVDNQPPPGGCSYKICNHNSCLSVIFDIDVAHVFVVNLLHIILDPLQSEPYKSVDPLQRLFSLSHSKLSPNTPRSDSPLTLMRGIHVDKEKKSHIFPNDLRRSQL